MLKKRTTILILFMLCIFSVQGFSQFKYKQRNTNIHNDFRFGPRIGIQNTNMFFKKGDQEYEAAGMVGFNAAFVMEYILQEVVSLRTGISYMQGGTIASTTQNRKSYEHSIKLNYVQVPFYIIPRFDQDNFTIFGAFGGYAGYSFGGTESAVGDTTYSSKISFNEKSGQVIINKLDLGLNIGGGIEYNNIEFGITYLFGLRNLTSVPNIVNNQILMFTVGYMFGGKY